MSCNEYTEEKSQMMKLPQWLQNTDQTWETDFDTGKKLKRSKDFVQKTLGDIMEFLRSSLFAEQIASSKGLMQSLDPRVKVFLAFVLLLTVNSVHHLQLLWTAYGILVIIALFSAISLKTLFKRVWLVIPLFTGIMVIPALFNWVRPGDPILTLWHFGGPVYFGPFHFPSVLAVTRQGLMGDILIISRVGISVTVAVMLTLTTRWRELLRALRSFFVPAMFVATLEMTYRYLFVLMSAIEDMFMARKSRDARSSSGKEQRRFVGSSIAVLFAKSHQMSDEIYTGMLARGYTGEVKLLETFKLQMSDLFAGGLVTLACLTLYIGDKVLNVLH